MLVNVLLVSVLYFPRFIYTHWSTYAWWGLFIGLALSSGLSLFRYDLPPGPREWVKGYFNLKLVREHASGGHFAPAENPEAVVADLRDTFRPLR